MINALRDMAEQVIARTDDGDAIRFGGHWHRWSEVGALAREIQRLVRESGADPRAPVLFVARNIPSALATFLALLADGRTIRLVYSFQSSGALAGDVARLAPGIVIAAREDLGDELCEAVRQAGAAMIVLKTMAAHALPGFERTTAELAADAPLNPVIEIQTSGTTGAPKRFPVSYEQAFRRFVDRPMPYTASADGTTIVPFLVYMSFANLSGLMSLLPALLGGKAMILEDRFSLDSWREFVRTYRPVAGGLQPAAVNMLLAADVPKEELSSLRSVVCGSAPLSAEAHRAFEERYGITILKSYGATEFQGMATIMTLDQAQRFGEAKFGSVGRAVPGIDLRVVDRDSGELLAPGETGLLEVRADHLGQDWLRTSDLASIDADGFLFIHGRADGAIIRGGFKLMPETIERALLQHDAVAAVVVVGIADQRLGEVPGAAIQYRTGADRPDQATLTAHLRELVPATYIPVHWRVVEEFALTPSLKIDRGAVRRLFAEAVAA